MLDSPPNDKESSTTSPGDVVMSGRDRRTDLLRLPTSGQILGKVVRALDIHAEILDNRTARRLFEGGNVSEARRIEIYEDFAKNLMVCGVIPAFRISDIRFSPYHRIVAASLLWASLHWDRVAGRMRSQPFADVPVAKAAVPYLRLAVVDLSMRLVGLLRACEIKSIKGDLPSWCKERSHGLLLRSLLERSGLTRDELADKLDVTDNTVDSWLDSISYPSDTNVASIAQVVSTHIQATQEPAVLADLRRHHMLCRIGDLLARYVDRGDVVDLVGHLLKYTKMTLDGLAEFSRLPEDRAMAANLALLMLGSQFTSAGYLARSLWRQETDPIWRADLLAATNAWNRRLDMTTQYVRDYPQLLRWSRENLPVTDEEAEALTEKTIHGLQGDLNPSPAEIPGTGFAFRIKGDARFSAGNRMIQARQARAEGDAEAALKHLRRAVELQALNAEYHFQLGAQLGQMGHTEEGIQECWLAVQLKPGWDLPLIEIGIILVNNHKYEEGLEHLEMTAKKVPTMTTHLAFSLAYARMQCNRYSGALGLFEAVLKEKPDHAIAIDCAAHCCLKLGETDGGIALAKEALKRGAPSTYRDWKEGKYKKP